MAKATSSYQVRLGNADVRSLYCKGAWHSTTTASPNLVVTSDGQIMRSTGGGKGPVKLTVSKDLPVIAAHTSTTETFTVEGAHPGSGVMINPAKDLPDGLIIAFTRVSAEGIITARFLNTTNADMDAPLIDFLLTVVN